MKKGPLQDDPARPGVKFIEVTWTPTKSQIGQNLFCFQAEDSNGWVVNTTHSTSDHCEAQLQPEQFFTEPEYIYIFVTFWIWNCFPTCIPSLPLNAHVYINYKTNISARSTRSFSAKQVTTAVLHWWLGVSLEALIHVCSCYVWVWVSLIIKSKEIKYHSSKEFIFWDSFPNMQEHSFSVFFE